MKKKVLLLALIALLTLSLGTFFTACSKEEEQGPVKLAAPTDFDYDGTYITWADTKGAVEYNVVINDAEPIDILSSTVKYKATEDKFTVSVTAKAAEGSEEYLDSDTVTKIFDKIAAVENIEFGEDATMTWDAVSGATAYVVEYNKGTKTRVTDCVFNELPAGTYSVKVKAVRDAEPSYVYYTVDAKTTNITVLESVASDRITYDGEKIKWNAISSAINYKVWIDESDMGTTTTNEFTYDAKAKSFNVKVLALGNAERKIYNAAEKADRNFLYLAPATNLSINEGVLTWDAVKDAEGYEIKILNKGTQKVQTNSFSGFTPGEETTLQIRAYSSDNTYFAGWTDEMTYLVLKAPVLQWIDKDLNGSVAKPVFWDQVENAKGYYALIEGPNGYQYTENLGVDGVNLGSDFLTAGTYTVKVKSLADKNNACDSVYSDPITVVRLAAPELDAGAPIESDPNDVTKGFKVTFNLVPSATDYRLYKNGVESKLSGGKLQITDYMNSTSTEGDEASFVLQSVGSSYNTRERKVVLDSLYDESKAFKISVLATPSVTTTPIEGMTYNFGQVQGTNKYTVKVDGDYHPIDDGDNGYDLSGLSGGHNYTVSVNARGDGARTLSSKYSEAISVSRLAAPTNVQINTENSGAGNLYFNPIENASSYEYTIDGAKYTLEKDQTDNIANKIGKDTTIFMIALGNYYKNNIYYMDSPKSETYTFTKLQTPTISPTNALKGTKLIWTKISSYGNFSPSYRIVNSKNIVVRDKIDDGSFDLDPVLAGGQTETYYIYAIGNGTKYINSDKPVAGLTITRLEMPDVQIDLDEKAYAWDPVPNTKEYQVYIDGELKSKQQHSSTTDQYYYRPGFTQNKDYAVKITAVGNNEAGLMDSPSFTKTQKTRVLTAPNYTYYYDKDAVANDGNIVVTVSEPINGALGYAYLLKGSEQRQMLHYYGSSNDFTEENVTTYSFNAKSSGEYTVDVYALGGGFIYDYSIKDYVATLNSPDHGAIDKITLLGVPNGLSINGDGVLSWNEAPGTMYYELEITFDGETYNDEETITTSLQFKLKKYLSKKGKTYNPGTTPIAIKIRATNPNSKTINSDWSSEFQS